MAGTAARGRWEWPALAAVLLLAVALRAWGVADSGFGTDYYAAGVKSQLAGWRNLLFNSFDPAGFVSLDKPPVAFWIQAASAALFGFSGPAILLPQAVEGVASVAILHHLVARRFGAVAGLIAALLLALTPVAVAVDRSGNTDSALVLFLLLAAWAGMRAAETGRLSLLLLSALLVGVAFNVKMLVALGLAPAIGLLYLLEAPRPAGRRLAHLALAGVVGGAVALAWIATFDLSRPETRPYAGSSQGNSMIELAVGHNGLERFVRPGRAATAAPVDPARIRAFDAVPAGPLRLADRRLAAQAGWLFPLALAGLIACLAAGRTRRADAILWGGWALTYAVLFSATGGIFHAYYLAVLAPPLAALGGIAIVAARARPWLLGAALVLTAAWQLHVAWDVVSIDTARLAFAAALAGSAVAAAALQPVRRAAAPALVLGLLALLAAPTAWALSPILAPGSRMLPSASLARVLGEDPRDRRPEALATEDARFLDFLRAEAGGERFLLAVPNARLAAPAILRAGASVAAIGGFMGHDPIVTPERLIEMAQAGEVRFVLIGPRGSFGFGAANEARRRDFARAVRAAGEPVPQRLWRTVPSAAEWGEPGYARLYDMRAGGVRRAAATGAGEAR